MRLTVGSNVLSLVLASMLVIVATWLFRGRTAEQPRAAGGPPASPAFEPTEDALFSDDFSNADLARWTADQEGVWTVQKGVLRASLPDKKQLKSFLRVEAPEWADYAVDVDVCMTRGVDKGVAVRVQGSDGVAVDLRGNGYHDVLLHRGIAKLGSAKVRNENDRWHHIRIETRGTRYRVWINGDLHIEADDRSRKNGGIALAAYTGGAAKCTVYYDNVVVTRLVGDAEDGSEA